jgi:hypothetical protein
MKLYLVLVSLEIAAPMLAPCYGYGSVLGVNNETFMSDREKLGAK